MVDVPLRDPFAEDDLSPVPRLDRVLHERIPIVIVADVVMVEFRRASTLIFRPNPAVIPVRHNYITVWIERRD